MAKQQRLEESEIGEYLLAVPDWSRDGNFIARRYGFDTFPMAVAFVNQVATVSESQNHHPFIAIDYKLVTLRLTSWHAGGLTSLDFAEAKEFDKLYAASFPSKAV